MKFEVDRKRFKKIREVIRRECPNGWIAFYHGAQRMGVAIKNPLKVAGSPVNHTPQAEQFLMEHISAGNIHTETREDETYLLIDDIIRSLGLPLKKPGRKPKTIWMPRTEANQDLYKALLDKDPSLKGKTPAKQKETLRQRLQMALDNGVIKTRGEGVAREVEREGFEKWLTQQCKGIEQITQN